MDFDGSFLPELILGNYPCIPHFVGCEVVDPPPPNERSVQHQILISHVTRGALRLVVVTVRLFANSGVRKHGPPIYEVVAGALPVSDPGSTIFRKNCASQNSATIALPLS